MNGTYTAYEGIVTVHSPLVSVEESGEGVQKGEFIAEKEHACIARMKLATRPIKIHIQCRHKHHDMMLNDMFIRRFHNKWAMWKEQHG